VGDAPETPSGYDAVVELAVVVVVVVELEVLEPPPHPASIKGINTRARGQFFS
jgi:hypothetical protein